MQRDRDNMYEENKKYFCKVFKVARNVWKCVLVLVNQRTQHGT